MHKVSSYGWVALWALLTAAGARADVSHIELDPSTLNAQAPAVHGPHLALHDAAAPSQHRLVIYLPGTNGNAAAAADILDALAHAGYHALALDYPNTVVAAKLRGSKDAHAFDAYRRAIVHGGVVDETLTVAAASSIEARIVAAVQHIAAQRGNEGWREFSAKQGVSWDKLILIGHSQGAGHAAFLAHEHKVAKVLTVAGPQDYLTELGRPAVWLSAASITPRERYRALLHREDEYDVKLQIAANRALLGPKPPEPVSFNAEPPTQSQAPAILVSERPLAADAAGAKHAHGSLRQPQYAAVWLYLLSH